MNDRLPTLEKRFEELTARLGTAELLANREEFAKAAKEHSELTGVVDAYRRWKKAVADIASNEEMVRSGDKELADMAYDEVARLNAERVATERELEVLLTPKDPYEGKTVLLEVRAGTGGDEAALFAGEHSPAARKRP